MAMEESRWVLSKKKRQSELCDSFIRTGSDNLYSTHQIRRGILFAHRIQIRTDRSCYSKDSVIHDANHQR